MQSAREKGSVHTNCREGMLRYEYSTVYSKGLAILFFLTWSHEQLAGRAGFWVSRRCGARVDVMAPDVQNWRQRRAFSGPGVEMIDNNRIMAKKQRITDEDLVSRGLAASTTELALPPAGCEMASVGAPRYNFRLRRRESVSLVETQPQKTRQTSNMDTFTTAGEAADEERHLQSSLVLNAYHRRGIDAVSVSVSSLIANGHHEVAGGGTDAHFMSVLCPSALDVMLYLA